MSSSKKKIRKEIKEYSHLLRALKTSSTSDLAAHIYKASSQPNESTSIGSSAQTVDPRTKKDFWTRWPLMPEEVFRPPLGFDEEFSTIAEHALNDEPLDSESTLSDHLASSDAAALTGSSLCALGQCLSLLSDNFPHVDKGVQSRVKPADWKLVMEQLAGSKMFPEEVLQTVSRRMNALYNSSNDEMIQVLPNVPLRQAEAEVEEMEEQLMYDIYPADV